MNNSFDLKMPNHFNIFASTDEIKKYDVTSIDIKNLIPYKNHPFKLYKGERFNDMVESIKNNGLFSPIIVRPIEDNRFDHEILSGHNRVEASKSAGLETLPCIVKDNLTDEEAHLIVTESNLIQRSFADLSHSERAESLATHYEALKKQGKRNDLILEIEKLVLTADKPQDNEENSTTCQVGKRLNTDERIAEKYGLSARNVARYLRINKLNNDFKEMLDSKELAFLSAENISFLKPQEQELLFSYITDNELNIDMKKAEQLKLLSSKGKFENEEIDKIFQGKKVIKKPTKSTTMKFKRKRFENYFSENEKEEVIETTILEALDFYFEYKDQMLGGEENVQNNDETAEI